MKVCLAEEMRNIDRKAMESYGIPGVVLMENAAISCLESFEKFHNILIVCGKGNNAGDGLCIARHLVNKGKAIKVYLALGRDFSGDALINYNILCNMGFKFYDCNSPDFINDLKSCDCVCDAIFGTGIKGEIKSPVKEVIDKVNQYSPYTVSIDIPSGVDADTGRVVTCCVRANKTVTFQAYKRGHLLYPGAEYAGEIEVTDISIPKEALENVSVNTIDKEHIEKIMPKRCKNSQKGDYGKILIIGGSVGMAGAVALAAKAALKVGAGLVTACVPYEINDIVQVLVPEAMTYPVNFEKEHEKIAEKIKNYDVILFGNGIGREGYIKSLLENIIKNATCPVVIDADGLYALKDMPDLLKKSSVPLIITPHSMEFARLIGKTVEEVEEDRIGLSIDFAEKYPVTLVLKGNHTIITTPEKKQYINMTGNSGMATAGSGDVLAGMVAGFAPRCKSLSEAGILSVYLHGKAGDIKKSQIGENSITAGDIIMGIHHIFPVEINDNM